MIRISHACLIPWVLLAAPCLQAQTPTQPATPSQAKTAPPAGTTRQNPSSPAGFAPGVGSPGSQSAGQTPGLSPGPIVAIPARIGVAAIPQPSPGAAITLDQALALAAANEPAFAAAAAAEHTAKLDRSIARSALLPSAVYHNQFLYTQPLSAGARGTAATAANDSVKFIANNTVHEYISQASVTENIGLTQYAALLRANAALAITEAELEIARRGLTATVVSLFYNLITGATRVDVQQRAVDEAADFLKQTQNRELAREVAHADVIKAQIQLRQHERDLADAKLSAEKAHLELGVLLYADPRSPYTVTIPEIRPVPDKAAITSLATANNAELKSATASFRSAQAGVTTAVGAFFPDLSLNYSYGIDAPQFAANAPDGSRYLGYSASATLDIPIFDWLATPNKVRQAHIARDAARVVLSNAQRRTVANIEEFSMEATVAYDALGSLRQSVTDSRESLRLTRLRYTNGEATVLEVVDAQNTLTTAELALEDGMVRYQLALANLQTITGTF